MDKPKVKKLAAIRQFFEAGGGRKVTMEEFKELIAAKGSEELAQLAAVELGVELES